MDGPALLSSPHSWACDARSLVDCARHFLPGLSPLAPVQAKDMGPSSEDRSPVSRLQTLAAAFLQVSARPLDPGGRGLGRNGTV